MASRNFGGPGDGGGPELELDLSPGEAERLRRERAGDRPPATTTGRHRAPTTADDEREARRLSAYGEPPGFFGALIYALHVLPQRRRNRRTIADGARRRDVAIQEADRSYLELGRRLHRLASDGQADLSPVKLLVDRADHALLRWEQVKRERRTRKERALAQQRVDDTLRRLGVEALEHGLDRVDRDATSAVVAAVREANRLSREVRLRQIGLDLYDHPAVTRGLLTLLLLLALLGAAAIYALLAS